MQATALLVAATVSALAGQPGGGGTVDFTPRVEFAEFMPARVMPHEDMKTGFLVGGKNPTERILKLTGINGLAIAQLEADMRPKKSSQAGFLGEEEKLLEILAVDNRYVVEKLGLTHQEVARHLHAMGAIGNWQQKHKQEGAEFVYHGRRFKVDVAHSRGTQPSPFRDGTKSGSDATVTNVETGKKLRYGLLLPYMIERYGFYEGKETRYRLEPSKVLEVLDFLKKN